MLSYLILLEEVNLCKVFLDSLYFFFFFLQVVRDVLLLGHRQAFAWVDEWIGRSLLNLCH